MGIFESLSLQINFKLIKTPHFISFGKIVNNKRTILFVWDRKSKEFVDGIEYIELFTNKINNYFLTNANWTKKKDKTKYVQNNLKRQNKILLRKTSNDNYNPPNPNYYETEDSVSIDSEGKESITQLSDNEIQYNNQNNKNVPNISFEIFENKRPNKHKNTYNEEKYVTIDNENKDKPLVINQLNKSNIWVSPFLNAQMTVQISMILNNPNNPMQGIKVIVKPSFEYVKFYENYPKDCFLLGQWMKRECTKLPIVKSIVKSLKIKYYDWLHCRNRTNENRTHGVHIYYESDDESIKIKSEPKYKWKKPYKAYYGGWNTKRKFANNNKFINNSNESQERFYNNNTQINNEQRRKKEFSPISSFKPIDQSIIRTLLTPSKNRRINKSEQRRNHKNNSNKHRFGPIKPPYRNRTQDIRILSDKNDQIQSTNF